MLKNYKTLAKQGSAELIERRSRFIATVKPVVSEAEALEFIDKVRSKYYDATHNVYAYIIKENNICRCSDDGEPSGTAGVPVLEVIRKEDITDAAVVVTRYFGGVMLGAGGLVRAYSAACKAGIDANGIIERVLCDEVHITTDYNMYGKLQYYINENGHRLDNVEYLQEIKLTLLCQTSLTKKAIADMIELTNARIIYEFAGQKYITVDS